MSNKRIQPAVSRFTISHPTRLRAAMSHRIARSLVRNVNSALRLSVGTKGSKIVPKLTGTRRPRPPTLSVRIQCLPCTRLQDV